jgi:hypothetical protein
MARKAVWKARQDKLAEKRGYKTNRPQGASGTGGSSLPIGGAMGPLCPRTPTAISLRDYILCLAFRIRSDMV